MEQLKNSEIITDLLYIALVIQIKTSIKTNKHQNQVTEIKFCIDAFFGNGGN